MRKKQIVEVLTPQETELRGWGDPIRRFATIADAQEYADLSDRDRSLRRAHLVVGEAATGKSADGSWLGAAVSLLAVAVAASGLARGAIQAQPERAGLISVVAWVMCALLCALVLLSLGQSIQETSRREFLATWRYWFDEVDKGAPGAPIRRSTSDPTDGQDASEEATTGVPAAP